MRLNEIKYDSFLKLISFLFAVSFFLFSLHNFRKSFEIRYNITFEGIPGDLVLADDVDKAFSAEYDCPFLVWGTSFTRRKQSSIKIDFSYKFFPVYSIDVSELEIPNFPMCNIKSIQPRSLTIGFERLISKKVKVLPDIVNNLPVGYAYSVEVEPSEVLLSGPESKVKDKEVAYTDFIVLRENRTSPMVLEVPIFKFDKGVRIYPDSVKVSIKISSNSKQ